MAQPDQELWRETSRYLDEVLELDPSQREPWLAALEGSHPAVGAELRELLALHAANCASGFMERSPLGEESLAGQRIGAYTLERALGRGGMGSVWLARRSDGKFEAQVAIKLLDRRGLGEAAAGQIRHEATLLARLTHPNIARLFDAGVRENGQPYLILEYVEGEPIDRYSRAQQLSLPARLRLFLEVADAVAHAHAQLIVHRDLKPSNVLVTPEGVVKLLDFGVAALLAGAADAERAAESEASARALTPGYASPEQLRGEPVAAAADVYSLGVLLYVLITGEHPFGARTTTHTRLVRAALTQDPHLASTRLATAAERRRVRGDLDAIIAHALVRDPAQRYATAAELAADVRRFLGQLPVHARPASRVYVAHKFIARHARAVAAVAALSLALTALAYLVVDKYWFSKRAASPAGSTTASASSQSVAFNPPSHSIAVLPFVNLSGDPGQEYFSDGLTEQLLSSLVAIEGLQVAARTSAFSFKGKDTDIGTIARKLNVGAVLEGSVRRSGNTVRVTTQLINAVTGFHLWSHTYDRDLGDVLKLQTDIANAVASALKVSLLADVATKIELGGTRNPAAFDAYLRGRKAHLAAHNDKGYQTAIAAYTEAVRLDPNYALAFANRSLALSSYALEVSGPVVRESFDEALRDARKAITLTPDLAEGRMALATHFEQGSLDFTRADEEHERALELAPGNAEVLSRAGRFAVYIGRSDAGIAATRRAVVLDPLNRDSHRHLGQALYFERKNKEAIAALQDALTLDPEYSGAYAERGLAYYQLGDFERARTSCESKPDYWLSQQCLALSYDKLGRHVDAEAVLAKMQAANGDDAAFQYAEIYVQWGNKAKALEWLETALRVRDPGLIQLKTAALLDPLRKEPGFQAIERALNFPD